MKSKRSEVETREKLTRECTNDRSEGELLGTGPLAHSARLRIHFAALEISKLTSNPEQKDWKKAKRLGKYLKLTLRVLLEHRTSSRGCQRKKATFGPRQT